MNKMWKITVSLALVALSALGMGLLRQRVFLRENLIRLHVVANSDSQKDQAVKLEVRDAILAYIQRALPEDASVAEARTYLKARLQEVEQVAVLALKEQGISQNVRVSLKKDAYPTRDYDSFSLPAGVYEGLRVELGGGQGKNWWCVVFPRLCLESVGQSVKDTAVGAGFSQSLTQSVTGQEGYEVRFFLLELVGKVENFLFQICN